MDAAIARARPASPAQLPAAIASLTDLLDSEESLTPTVVGAAVLEHLVGTVPGTRAASLTQLRSKRPATTVAASDQVAVAIDALQYVARQGPCLDALASGRPVVVRDLTADPRWPNLNRRAVGTTSVRATASMPIVAPGFLGSLNLYAELPGAFCGDQQPAVMSAAAVARLTIIAIAHRNKARNLAVALESNRRIGVAIGILMSHRRCTYGQAFAAMVAASQLGHRKLHDLAEDVIHTGALPQVATSPAASLGSATRSA